MPPKKFFRRKRPFGSGDGDDKSAGFGSGNDDNAEIRFDLGVEKKKVTVRKFKTMKLVDIREYYQREGANDWLPGKKGISLTEEQWNALISRMMDINEALHSLDSKEDFELMKKTMIKRDLQLKAEDSNDGEGSNGAESASNHGQQTIQDKQGSVQVKHEDIDEEDEDFDDIEFEDVSEEPVNKKLKTEP